MVEAAITLPALILLTMMVVQYALVWHARHIAQAAAADGLRAARAYQAAPDEGATAANQWLAQVAPHLLTGTHVNSTRQGGTVSVSVHARVLKVIPFASFDVDETASGPVETFVAPQ